MNIRKHLALATGENSVYCATIQLCQRCFSVIIPGIFLLVLSACGGKAENSESNTPPNNSPDDPVKQGNNTTYDHGSPLVRRLTKNEYVYTIKDIFGLELNDTQKSLIPSERSLAGFRNLATTQTVVGEHVASYQQLANEIVEKIDFESFLLKHSNCDGNTSSSIACLDRFIKNAGLELFRRPPDSSELASLENILEVTQREDFSFTDSAKTLTSAMLQFPAFLYRLEQENNSHQANTNGKKIRKLSSHEIAVRLSYFLWSSTPDDELLAAAAKNELQSNEQILNQAKRMLQDTNKVQRSTERYIWDWLKLKGVTEEHVLLRDALIDQYQYQTWQQKLPVFKQLTSQNLHLPEAWASDAGIKNAADNKPINAKFSIFDTSVHPGLIGLIAHPATLLAMVSSDDSEHPFIHRGLYLHQRLFCGDEIPSPPETLRTSIDEFSDNLPANISLRDEADRLHEVPQCGFCHRLFEPLAFPFEPYDIEAHYQMMDKHGNTVRTDGSLSASISGTGQVQNYDNIIEYMELVAQSPRVKECMMENHLKFALGRELEKQEKPAISQILQTLEQSDGTYYDLVYTIVTHKSFTEVLVQ